MKGTFLFTVGSDGDSIGPTSEHVLQTFTVHEDMLPGDLFEFFGFFKGTRAATIRIREDSVAAPTSPTGSVILSLSLTAGQGNFYSTATYITSGIKLLKVTGEQGAGSGSPQLARYELSWTCNPPVPPPPGTIKVDDVELLAHDVLLLTFSESMVNDTLLRSPSSYTITPVSSGISVTVREVLAGHDNSTTQVVLVFTPPTLGEVYTVATNAALKDIDGNTMNVNFLSRLFEDRLTKMDSVAKNTAPIYALSSTAILRQVFQAISRSDERIGGNRRDTLG